ncbi:MAG: HEAT repeat domain-containing protein [Waltera sp.]
MQRIIITVGRLQIQSILYNSMTIDRKRADRVVIKPKKYGTGRQMLVLSLGEYKSDLSLNCLVSLLNDEEVRGHALQALGKCGNPEVLSDIEMYCNSENNWIKKVAINAAKKIKRKYL